MMVCPQCGEGALYPIRIKTPFAKKEKIIFRCSFCLYETEDLPKEKEESEAQRLMREHLREFHGVE